MEEGNSTSPIDGLWSYLLAIDWTEPWLSAVVGFHAVCSLTTAALVMLDQQTVQMFTFLVFLGIVYVAEYINKWGAENYRLFSRHQYFDSNGMFISLILSTPLLMNCFILVMTWMWKTIGTMIKLKRAKLREQMKSVEKKDN